MPSRTPFTNTHALQAREFSNDTMVVFAPKVQDLERSRDRWKRYAEELWHELDSVRNTGALSVDAGEVLERMEGMDR